VYLITDFCLLILAPNLITYIKPLLLYPYIYIHVLVNIEHSLMAERRSG